MALYMRSYALLFCLCLLLTPFIVHAETLLLDRNGDARVKILSFGDSITAGVGDSAATAGALGTGPGYPGRLSQLLGLPITNRGVPGEMLTQGGESRFPGTAQDSDADVIVLLEGFNDAFRAVSSLQYRRSLQRAVNITRALGKTILLVTLYPPCCNHQREVPFVAEYNNVVRELAGINGAAYSDLERSWNATCRGFSPCPLLHLPEGLHPNPSGYDVIAQILAGGLYGIDLLQPDGAGLLAEALGVPPESIIIKPESPA